MGLLAKREKKDIHTFETNFKLENNNPHNFSFVFSNYNKFAKVKTDKICFKMQRIDKKKHFT